MSTSWTSFWLPILVSLALFSSVLAAGHPAEIEALLERLKDASEAEVERVSDEVEAMALRPGDESAGILLNAVAVAWYQNERYPEALALLEQLAVGWPDSASLTYLRIAQIHRDKGDEAKEIEALLASVRHPKLDTGRDLMDADNTSNIAYRRLGSVYEARGEWTRALVFWERWKPTSWCGNEAVAYDHQRQMGIARCRFHLKDKEAALRSVWRLVSETGCLNGAHPSAALLYAELSAEAGQLTEARRAFRGLPRDRRERFLVSIAIWQGHQDENPEAVLDALDFFGPDHLRWLDHSAPIEIHGASKILSELGPAARAVIERRVREEDIQAVAVAGITGNRDFLPALRALVEREDIDENLARTAKNALELLNESAQQS